MNCIECGNPILEEEKSVETEEGGGVARAHNTCLYKTKFYPVSLPDTQRLESYIREHQKLMRTYYSYDDLPSGVNNVIEHYRALAANALQNTKNFRDDVIVWLRAMSLVLEMTGNAATHREKGARLRGCIEMIESAMQKLRAAEIGFQSTYYHWDDIFRSDFPVRSYIEKIHKLQDELKAARNGTIPDRDDNRTEAPF